MLFFIINFYEYLSFEKALNKMENLVISVNTKADSLLLMQLAKKLGYKIFSVSDTEKRFLARKKIAQVAEKNRANNASIQEIDEVVNAIRTKRYAKK